jgi:hypothetical protein
VSRMVKLDDPPLVLRMMPSGLCWKAVLVPL